MLTINHEDGSRTVTVQKLVPVELVQDDAKLAEEADNALNKIENALGFEPGTLTSTGYWAGHADTDWDALMTAEEQAIVRMNMN